MRLSHGLNQDDLQELSFQNPEKSILQSDWIVIHRPFLYNIHEYFLEAFWVSGILSFFSRDLKFP